MSDTFVDSLNDMIQMLLSYKPGSRTLSNVIKLCQTLGLESFVDQVDSNKSRLSIASNIVVIDIDYQNEMDTILDVKLVLASNFDKFNYFNESGDNILLKCLSDAQDLKAFHHNLNFLVFLDSFSNIDIESGNASLDLFKYYTDLPKMLQDYLIDQGLDFKVKVNENSTFGISIYDSEEHDRLLTIGLQKSPNSDKVFYEYVYDSKLKEWVNESSDASTQGINLVVRFDEKVAFPESWVMPDIQATESPTKFEMPPQNLLKSAVRLQNELTSDLLLIDTFFIYNEDIALVPDLLKWLKWYKLVLQETFNLVTLKGTATNQVNMTTSGTQTKQRRRSSAISNRRSSVTNDSIIRDSGIPQFSLKEILDQPVISDTEDDDTMGEDPNRQIRVVLNEEYIYAGNTHSCSYQDNDEDGWKQFIAFLRAKLS